LYLYICWKVSLFNCNPFSICDSHASTSCGSGLLASNHFKIIHFLFDQRIFATSSDIDFTLFNIIVHGYFAITLAASSLIDSTAVNSMFQLCFLVNNSNILASSAFIDQNSNQHVVFHNSSAVSLVMFSRFLNTVRYLRHSNFLAISGVNSFIHNSIHQSNFVNSPKLSGLNFSNHVNVMNPHLSSQIAFASARVISFRV
jgi:hypothetical protein